LMNLGKLIVMLLGVLVLLAFPLLLSSMALGGLLLLWWWRVVRLPLPRPAGAATAAVLGALLVTFVASMAMAQSGVEQMIQEADFDEAQAPEETDTAHSDAQFEQLMNAPA